ncbi:MAG: orotate phosphoribosyltransferase, partial [Gammaproteobacteria bacterium]|nr:orotate phosphoribosyltransferase [Gammaproteobacteria bacterium]
FDMLFGPTYKGIPLVTATAVALAKSHKLNIPFAFDRKEAKHHGEGGRIVGAPLKGRVLIIDDVITAGTAIRHSAQMIREAGAEVAGVVLALDRQEKGLDDQSATQELAQSLNAPVISIASLDDVMTHLNNKSSSDRQFLKLKSYREAHGCQ